MSLLNRGTRVQTQHGHIEDGEFILVPIEDLVTPRGGRICSANRFWTIRDGKYAQFYKTYGSPQCNPNEMVCNSIVANRAARLAEKGCVETVVKIEMAFVPPGLDGYDIQS